MGERGGHGEGPPASLTRAEMLASLRRQTSTSNSPLAYAPRDRDQKVFLVGVEEACRYEYFISHIPLPCYCKLCNAEMTNKDSRSKHFTGKPHLKNLKAAVETMEAEEARASQQDRRSRSQFPPASSSTPPAKSGKCFNRQCGRSISARHNEKVIKCKWCGIEQDAPRA